MKPIFFSLLTLLFFSSSVLFSQNKSNSTTNKGSIKWLTMEEASKLNKEHPKKYWVNIHSETCRWCKKMDKETFTNEQVIQYINENYYPVRLSIHNQSDIQWNGKTYRYIKEGPYAKNHELVLRLAMGKNGTPINTIINENGDDIELSLVGFLTRDKLFERVLEN